MKKIVIASTQKSSGKTSLIVGTGLAYGSKKISYFKPLGERLVYKKKRLWDYDSALMASIFQLQQPPEDLSIGFDHSKLRFMYTESSIKEKLLECCKVAEQHADIVFIEGNKDLSYGASVHLDPLSVAKAVDASLVVVATVSHDAWLDNIAFLVKYSNVNEIKFRGVIANKVQDVEEFKSVYQDELKKLGVPLLGVIPFKKELTQFTASYLADYLLARVIAAHEHLNKKIENIFVGAMSVDAAVRNPLFSKPNKLIITSGDRTDMILAALESNTACILLTNNITPPAYVLSKATEQQVPILLVTFDTYQVARQIDDMEPLLTHEDHSRLDLLKELVSSHVDLKAIVED